MEILKKHSALISMTNKDLTLTQKKSLNVLYLGAKKTLEKGQELGKWHNVELNYMREMLGITKENSTHLKDELIKIIKIVVEYNIFNKDKKVWGAFSLLTEVKIELNENGENVVRYKLAEMIEENLVLPNVFAKIDLKLIKDLKSKYSVILYELLEDYKNVNIPKMMIEEFKKFLGIQESKYTKIYDFKKWVIEVIKKEINEKTDFTINYNLEKKGPKIVAIQWVIIDNDEAKQNLYFEKMEFIERVRKEYKKGQVLYDLSDSQGVKIMMGANGLLAKKYKGKKDIETIKKAYSAKLWDFLFKNQNNMKDYDTSHLLGKI